MAKSDDELRGEFRKLAHATTKVFLAAQSPRDELVARLMCMSGLAHGIAESVAPAEMAGICTVEEYSKSSKGGIIMNSSIEAGFVMQNHRRVPEAAAEELREALSVLADKYDLALVVLAAPNAAGDITLFSNLEEDEATDMLAHFAKHQRSES